MKRFGVGTIAAIVLIATTAGLTLKPSNGHGAIIGEEMGYASFDEMMLNIDAVVVGRVTGSELVDTRPAADPADQRQGRTQVRYVKIDIDEVMFGTVAASPVKVWDGSVTDGRPNKHPNHAYLDLGSTVVLTLRSSRNGTFSAAQNGRFRLRDGELTAVSPHRDAATTYGIAGTSLSSLKARIAEHRSKLVNGELKELQQRKAERTEPTVAIGAPTTTYRFTALDGKPWQIVSVRTKYGFCYEFESASRDASAMTIKDFDHCLLNSSLEELRWQGVATIHLSEPNVSTGLVLDERISQIWTLNDDDSLGSQVPVRISPPLPPTSPASPPGRFFVYLERSDRTTQFAGLLANGERFTPTPPR